MMFSRSSSSSTSRCTYGLSLSASTVAPALAAFFFAAIELPRLACGCRREHTRPALPLSPGGTPGLLERNLEDLVDVVDEPELQVLAQVLGDVLDVGLVEPGRDHGADPVARRGERLLLEPADGQHAAGQRDLAGHRDVVAHRTRGGQRAQRAGHRDAGARAVLGDGAGRDV